MEILKANSPAVSDITIKMKAYQSDNDYKAKAKTSAPTTTPVESDDNNW